MSKKPIALIIMDGFGYNHKDYGNAIRAAKTPNTTDFLPTIRTLLSVQAAWTLDFLRDKWVTQR